MDPAFIPVAFWFVRFDVQRKMIDIEKNNAGIAVATASIFDEESGYFSPQKVDKIMRQGYN